MDSLLQTPSLSLISLLGPSATLREGGGLSLPKPLYFASPAGDHVDT